MLAALHGRDEVVCILLLKGAIMDVTAKYGLSALMLAVINHHTEIARQLVDAGADPLIRGKGAPGFAGLLAADPRAAAPREPPDIEAPYWRLQKYSTNSCLNGCGLRSGRKIAVAT